MAYQAKRRDPLLDSKTQAVLERRGKELLGLVLLGAGVAAAMLLGSYSSDDPSWLAVTDEPARNLLGRFGASIASPLMVIVGVASWSLALLFIVWGVRLTLHRGEEALGRLIFAPIAVAVTAIYFATHAPEDGWGHSFGLGGLFGDTILGALLALMPTNPVLSLKLVALASAVAMVALTLYVAGVTVAEMNTMRRFCQKGVAAAMRAGLHGGAAALTTAVHKAEARREARQAQPRRPGPLARLRARREEAEEIVIEDDPAPAAAPTAPAKGLRMEPRIARPEPQRDEEDDLPEPELVQQRPIVPPNFVRGAAEVVRTPAVRPRTSRRAQAEAQPVLPLEETAEAYSAPPLALLADPAGVVRHNPSTEALEENARMLETVLDDYGVKGEIVSVRPGPVVTMYELEPAPGLKASRVIGLADDIARSMSALSARVSTVPGRSVIGIELPNATREQVVLREILSARDYGDGNQRLPLALGKDIGGDPVVANLARMPHLLIAGTTGSGKSVAINTMILSLLYKLSPEECRLIMIDPKMLELSVYDGIPHLLSPVVTDPKKAVVALKWVVAEMEERYRKMSKMGVRNIDGYNGRVRETLAKGETFSRTVQTGFDDETGDPVFETEEIQPEAMPYIVVIVDEMADLMMVAGKEIEACIQRLAQMARASGIHLIMATQRPSVDVITGTIKANFPTRISFQVTSKIDSRTILGEQGAEQLLGMGDMLYMAGGSKITRVHGPFVSDEEVEEVVRHLKSLGPPAYVGGVQEGPDEDQGADIDAVLGLGGNTDGEDALYDQAVAIVIQDRKCSTSYIQRKLAIGYNKAARLVEQMEEQGLVSPANHVGKREILVPEPQ
ncbi:DNA translocase FtsK [Roseitranquillus sediminis]|uniref:DNA translocase FtsK n=1 Tax=Roseitranquillus sediminis TaxID=2809051 RepID=UPI001D0CC6D9|nr:DNA translocase FtsK [Roseitranquillus sediminis]MBM9593708.1 DNA translocase FtsK 4TM domain-containing protein [Roseitranquillus sediminis]